MKFSYWPRHRKLKQSLHDIYDDNLQGPIKSSTEHPDTNKHNDSGHQRGKWTIPKFVKSSWNVKTGIKLKSVRLKNFIQFEIITCTVLPFYIITNHAVLTRVLLYIFYYYFFFKHGACYIATVSKPHFLDCQSTYFHYNSYFSPSHLALLFHFKFPFSMF